MEEKPCEDFKTGKLELSEFAECCGMGHYLCRECRYLNKEETEMQL